MKSYEIDKSVRDFIDASDVKGIYLYRKDGYICSYLRIYNFNLDLLKQEEKQGKTDALSASSRDDRRDFDYISLPREVDLDKYKETLLHKHSQELKIGKRHLLSKMMKQCAQISMGGKDYEHYQAIKVWQLADQKTRKNVEEALGERIKGFETKYKAVGIKCEIIQESEIIKLCNMFGNSIQGGADASRELPLFEPIPFLK